LKKSNNRVLFLKILLDIDQIHCIMFLVEWLFDTYLNCRWNTVLYAYIVRKKYEKNTKILI
jgi:hypothetical protein